MRFSSLSPSLVEVVLPIWESVVVPKIEDARREIGIPPAAVDPAVHAEDGLVLIAAGQWEIRLRVRETGDHSRALFNLHAMLNPPDPTTGFNGFHVRGSVTRGDQPEVRTTLESMVYSAKDWLVR